MEKDLLLSIRSTRELGAQLATTAGFLTINRDRSLTQGIPLVVTKSLLGAESAPKRFKHSPIQMQQTQGLEGDGVEGEPLTILKHLSFSLKR